MNETIKVFLTDDEKDSREVLTELLKVYADVAIVGEAASVSEAFDKITETKPDLVFLDIQMPGENGFSLLKRFGNDIPFEVIFVTSFNQFAINAIKFSALDYLLKPIEITELQQAVSKAQKVIGDKRRSNLQIENLIKNLENPIRERKMVVHSGEKVVLIAEKDILFIEADGRYSKIQTINSETFIISKYIKDCEEYLDDWFIRISKSTLINLSHIKSYSKGEPCIIEIANGHYFEVSRRKKQEVLTKLKA